jgi:hypothetical protein
MNAEEIDLREHIALVYALWLEDSAIMLMGSMDWMPLAGMS